MKIKVLGDNTLKHLGVKSVMDAQHNIQIVECKETIGEFGKTITGAISRSRENAQL